MLIECGPSPLLLRGKDWNVILVGDDHGWYHYVMEERSGVMWYRPQPARILNAAMVYGFVVAADDRILNWDMVPHLWEVEW